VVVRLAGAGDVGAIASLRFAWSAGCRPRRRWYQAHPVSVQVALDLDA
jgi:hypothetical protein